jgi:hypothetical protein
MLEKEKVVKQAKKEKNVPTVIVSSKFIQKEKATATTVDRHGNVVTMEELMKQSKEGQVGKGGAKVK